MSSFNNRLHKPIPDQQQRETDRSGHRTFFRGRLSNAISKVRKKAYANWRKKMEAA